MLKNGYYSFTSESVTEGHPDKVCDRVSDQVLDEILKQDADARVACETMAGSGFIIVTGEITTNAYVNIKKTVREVLRDIGYTKPEYGFDYMSVGILTSINEQSPDIALGVNPKKSDDYGAGDQGMMSGYATAETPEYMPAPILYAHRLSYRLAEVRKKGIIPYLRPDGKSQVTVEYEDGKPKYFSSVIIAAQHDDGIDVEKLRRDIKKEVIEPVCGQYLDSTKTQYFINNTGRFVIGGPVADSGCTGRKIIVDTYGGVGNHGGGAFSGKDPTKVDRTAAYMARYLAKNIVAAGLASRCEIQLAYVIGSREPLSIFINTHNTSNVDPQKISVAIRERFSLAPGKMIEYLKLKRPIFSKTSAYGHFGRSDPDFTWEKLDAVDYFKKAVS